MKILMLDIILLSCLLIAINLIAVIKLGWTFFKPYYVDMKRKRHINNMLKQIENNSHYINR